MSPSRRLLLDCKDISYETVWMDFPDARSTAKAVVSLPNRFPKVDGFLDYAVPSITVGPRDWLSLALSGSLKIAECIEEAFPGPEDIPLSVEAHMFQSIFTKYPDGKVLLSAVFPLILTAFIGVMRPHTLLRILISSVDGRTPCMRQPMDATELREAGTHLYFGTK